jgi:hypothetical protein
MDYDKDQFNVGRKIENVMSGWTVYAACLEREADRCERDSDRNWWKAQYLALWKETCIEAARRADVMMALEAQLRLP